MQRRYTTIPTRPARPARIATTTPQPHNRARFFEIDNLHVTLRLGSHRVETLYWGVLGDRWWRNYLHAHSFFEMCFAYEGRGTYRIKDQEHQIDRGDMFLATPGLSHEIISSRTQPLGIYFVSFTLLRLPEHQSTDADRSIDQLFESLGQTQNFVAKPTGMLEHTLELLTEEVSNKAAGFTQAIHGLTSKLLLDVARAYAPAVAAEPLPPLERGSKSIVHTALRYLRDNYARPLEVRDVAAQVHLSERHLARLFVRETGKSILEFLTDLRIEAASQLLMDDGIPIKQVARNVGYPDAHYFTTLFGKKTGSTPGQFRRQRGTKFRDETKRDALGDGDDNGE